MATYIQILSFRRKLKWYKRWLMPYPFPIKKLNLFCKIRLYVLFYLFNKQERRKFIRLSLEEYTKEDELQDRYFIAFNEYFNNPTYENKQNLELQKSLIKVHRHYKRIGYK